MTKITDNLEAIACSCNNPACALWFYVGKAETLGTGEDTIYWPPYLQAITLLQKDAPWWRRVWRGVRYILGVEHGYYHDMLIEIDDAARIRQLMDDYVQAQKAFDVEEGRRREAARP